jgi:ABC-2 type transport system permease protein
MLLGSFVSFIFRKLTQKWINANVLQTIFSVMFILSFAFFNFFSNEILPKSWISFLEQIDVVGSWFVNGIVNSNVLLVILFLLLHISIFIAFVLVMSGPLLNMNQQRTNLVYKRRDKIPQHVQSVMKHLMMKEWQRFVGTSVYFINTGFGILMLSIITMVSLFVPDTILELKQFMLAIQIEPIWLIFGVIGLALSTVYTPAVSLSLEGKNINLLKSLPIQAWTIIRSKIYFNLVITLPIVLMTSLVGAILFQIEVLTIALFLVVLVLFTVLLSIFFMYLNLWFPRFDFHQEVEVVKQSLAALVGVFGGFSIISALIWLVLDPLQGVDIYLQLTSLMVIESLLIIISGWFLRKDAQRYFQSFSV